MGKGIAGPKPQKIKNIIYTITTFNRASGAALLFHKILKNFQAPYEAGSSDGLCPFTLSDFYGAFSFARFIQLRTVFEVLS